MAFGICFFMKTLEIVESETVVESDCLVRGIDSTTVHCVIVESNGLRRVRREGSLLAAISVADQLIR